jgi:hypothetical protein
VLSLSVEMFMGLPGYTDNQGKKVRSARKVGSWRALAAQSPSPVFDQSSDECAPASLVGCSQASAIVTVVELVKQNEILPVGILLELFCRTMDRPHSVFFAGKKSDHPIGDLACDLQQVPFAI